ncbi:MAG TPA: hypothetical protein VLG27_03065 [Candidatus Saccharimonadia bacterium]|nr:hypothetical protein [Candidatus Saccharimonadia bacterium]
MLKGFVSLLTAGLVLNMFAAFPATSNYKLNSYGFGSGGGNSGTSTYSLEGISGEISGQTESTSNYTDKPGFIQTQQANVPQVTLSNPSSYYDKLLFVLDTQNNPTDALYALQVQVGVGSCDFASNIFYVKSDHTIGSTLTLTDYQTYSSWGGASGTTIIGLSSNTTYCIRAKATQGAHTESAYGPSSNAATLGQQISFCLYSNANCAAGGSSEAFSTLLPASVINSPTNLGVDFATNGDGGGKVYIYSANGGLKSVTAGHTIASATADLSSASEGFGAQIASSTQTSGGPLSKVSPYNNTSNNVGQIATTISTLLDSTTPLVGGQAAIQLKAKASSSTQAASNYAEIVTLIAAAAF